MKHIKQIISLSTILAILFASTITGNAASIKLSKSKKTITVGKTFTLSVKNVKRAFKWITSNKSVAKFVSVNSKKKSVKIKAIKEGKATITAKIGNKKLKCKITVKAKKQTNSKKQADTKSQVSTGNKQSEENKTITAEEIKTIKEYTVTSLKLTGSKYSGIISKTLNEYSEKGWTFSSIAIDNLNNAFIIFERDKIIE